MDGGWSHTLQLIIHCIRVQICRTSPPEPGHIDRIYAIKIVSAIGTPTPATELYRLVTMDLDRAIGDGCLFFIQIRFDRFGHSNLSHAITRA